MIEKFWNEVTSKYRGVEKVTITFDYVDTFQFLQENGFYKIRIDLTEVQKTYQFVQVKNGVITYVDVFIIRNFIKDYLKKINRLDVLNMIMRGGSMYLGPDKLMFLDCYPTETLKTQQP